MPTTTHPRRRSRLAASAVAVLAVASLGLAACSDDSSDDASSGRSDRSSETSTTTSDAGRGSDDGMSGDEQADGAMSPSGPACASVPADGAGSFEGMAQDPAATAASNNPALSTLVAAVKQADLVDTLNGPGPFTVLAPADSAFEKLPAGSVDALLADQAQLTDVLTYHVIAGEKMSAAQLAEAGTATSVEGGELTFAMSGDTLMVNGAASGVCVDVPTANATVHIIDTVLMPPA